MGMRWENRMDLTGVAIMVRAQVENGLDAGAQIIQARSDQLVPKEVGTLASTVRVKENRGGINTVAITYDGPYARYQHEHMWFKHPTGGIAKFLEVAMVEKQQEAINKAGDFIWDRVTSRRWGSL